MRSAPTGRWRAPALAALRQRADRSERSDEVVAHFEKLYPWPIYFALAYLVAVEPRPPAGDPVAGAKDWWGDNLIVPGLFRDYFAERERLGDAPVFGSALSATLCLHAGADQGVPPARQSHACDGADTAARQRPARQRRSHISRLVRPLLGRQEGDELLIEPEAVAGGSGGGRGRVDADAHALAAGERRAPRRQDVVPAAARASGSSARAGPCSKPAAPT